MPLWKEKEGTSISLWQSEAHKCYKWNETKWGNLWLIIHHRHEEKRKNQVICLSPGKSVRFLLRINVSKRSTKSCEILNHEKKKLRDLKVLTQLAGNSDSQCNWHKWYLSRTLLLVSLLWHYRVEAIKKNLSSGDNHRVAFSNYFLISLCASNLFFTLLIACSFKMRFKSVNSLRARGLFPFFTA